MESKLLLCTQQCVLCMHWRIQHTISENHHCFCSFYMWAEIRENLNTERTCSAWEHVKLSFYITEDNRYLCSRKESPCGLDWIGLHRIALLCPRTLPNTYSQKVKVTILGKKCVSVDSPFFLLFQHFNFLFFINDQEEEEVKNQYYLVQS